MEELVEFKNEKGETVFVEGDLEGNYISTLECGYVILPTGAFVKIGQDHGASLTDFCNLYFDFTEENKHQRYTTFEAIPLLCKEGFIVYLGTYRDSRSYIYQQDDFGVGIVFFPTELNLTDNQKESCLKLLNSNYGLIDNRMEKIKLEFSDGVNFRKKYKKEEIEELIKNRSNGKHY